MNSTTNEASLVKQANKAYRQADRLGWIFFISSFAVLLIPLPGDLWTGIAIGYAVASSVGYFVHQWALYLLEPGHLLFEYRRIVHAQQRNDTGRAP